MTQPTSDVRAALERLILVACGDTGQSRRCADFLLAWWNAGECGGFDLTDFWSVDARIREDMVALIGYIATAHTYPNELGYESVFADIIRQWRPARRARRRGVR